ncbi:MAG: tetratricopeptide repeat protein, partial [Verrucomicrobiota bacterium]
EIHLNQAPARPQAARQIFESLRTQSLTLSQSERLDYTGVWLELVDNNDAGFYQKAEAFLKDWPGSDYFPEVSMLLARRLFQDNRSDEAYALFAEAAESRPNSPFAQLASVFAAQSSPQDDRSILAWKTIAYSDSSYAVQGLHELGLQFIKKDRFDEARDAFSEILTQTERGTEIYYAALADTGYAYYMESLANGQDEALMQEASNAFSRLSRQSDAPAYWRYSAALRRARCLEAMGNQEVALEIYRSIVSSSQGSDSIDGLDRDQRTQEWVFRAGFFAIQILEANEDWRSAIKMADQLAQKNGPRAIEASSLAEKMRLKHWVWD